MKSINISNSISEIIKVCNKNNLEITVGEYGVTLREYRPDKHWMFSRLYRKELFNNTNADICIDDIISSFKEEANKKYEKDFMVVVNNVGYNKGS